METMTAAKPLTFDFSRPRSPRPKESGENGEAGEEIVPYQRRAEGMGTRSLAEGVPDDVVEAARATYVATGGNVSETARYHDLTTKLVQKLSFELKWPVYGTETAEKSNRVHMRKIMGQLETKMLDLASSLEVEKKPREVAATVSKRELSEYLEPLSSRHSAFKTVFDAWMRLGSVLYPEDFARDPDPANWRAAEERSQVRDLALLGGIAGLKRGMEDVISRHFVGGVPDRDRDTEITDAEVVE